MTNLRTAAQQALEAMGSVGADWICEASHHAERDQHKIGEPCPLQQRWHVAYQALRAALAEPVQDPVGYANERDLEQMRRHGGGALLWGRDQLDDLSGYTSLYTAPPQRKPLTEEEIDSIWDGEKAFADIYAIARAVERAHGIV